MAVACASRFAVLKLEDDDIFDNDSSDKNKSVQNNSQTTKNKSGNTKNGAVPSDSKTKPKKKKKSANDIAELQNLAFGSGANKAKNKGNAQNSGGPRNLNTAKQWEEWKKKDSEFVSGAYEQDLQQALLLSKIDYEEKKDVYDAVQKETVEQSKLGQKKKKKSSQKKEKGIMSLDEFQNMQAESGNSNKGKVDALDDFDSPEKGTLPKETDFFNKIDEDAEKIIDREHRQESYKKKEGDSNTSRVPDIALSLQYQEDLDHKNEEINSLKDEVTRLKDELKIVKTRNKKLYGILATGEMREKAEILVQIEQLTSVKDELTDQLNEFHASLEIERSKVHALQTELKKCHSSRKERKDS